MLKFQIKNLPFLFTKGNFLQVIGSRGFTVFDSFIQFNDQLALKSNVFYDFSFAYLINSNGCPSTQLIVYLANNDFFSKSYLTRRHWTRLLWKPTNGRFLSNAFKSGATNMCLLSRRKINVTTIKYSLL